ncbi:MAG: energy transducer TonB, partial [Lutibacter sp.]|uniref:energy transducer TonB n=1 Tax=Lutibacter sp. TaxID=1925666 RepID=UPI003859EA57
DKEGNIAGVKSRAPHIALQEEAIRVINLLPKMIPGKQDGNAVGVKYSLPIAFKVEGDNLKNKAKNNILLNAGNTKNPPLYILNGKEISKEDMIQIDPKSIKSLNVLKGGKAIKKYGQKGKDGVIEISIK